MNEITGRIREIFKNSHKSQADLARRLKVTPAYIWKLLNKDDAVPSDRLINDICEEFHIRKEWLVDGAGDPDQPLDRQDEIAKLTGDLFKGQKNSFKERLILALSRLNESEWEVLEKIAEEIAKEKD